MHGTAHSSQAYPNADVSYTYWDDLLDFCNRSGLSLSFDLNALSLRNRAGEWDSGEAQDLLAHVRDKGQTVWAFQLGNEPGHWQTRHGGVPGPAAHGADFVALRKLLGTQHRIQGPDVCFGAGTEDSPCASLEYLSTLLKTVSLERDGNNPNDEKLETYTAVAAVG